MYLDLDYIPFSKFGSYLAISTLKENKDSEEKSLFIRNVVEENYPHDKVFKVELMKDDAIIPHEIIATETEITLNFSEGSVTIFISDSNIIRFKGDNVTLKLTVSSGKYDYLMKRSDKQYCLNYSTQNTRFMLTSLHGEMSVYAPFEVIKCPSIELFFSSKDDFFEGVIEEFHCAFERDEYTETFETAKTRVEDEFKAFLNASPSPCTDDYTFGRELAAYITWSCVVPPKGNITRNSMYMSKNWMTSIWSWDYCFNAMALAKSNPELCFDQFMLFIDHQHSSGVFPDLVNPKMTLFSFCKPPIQGWTLKWILDRTDFLDEEKLNILYTSLCKWTNWWFNSNDVNHNNIPEYNHGNDCGWDNSTIFHKGIPVESPDLCSFLILQMDTLSDIASKLNKNNEAKVWTERADKLLNDMIKHFWTGDRFVSYLTDGSKSCVGDSLILFMPVILGDRLPSDIKEILIKGLKEENRFLTENGLATESISSPYYAEDGYWRGPIWAPSSMLLIDGLVACGEKEFAADLANRFCKMASKSGMAENYDAITGEPLCDRAFTWTSSVFLILASEYCNLK